MASTTRFTSYGYGEEITEAVDLDASGAQFRSSRAIPPMTARESYFPDDSAPLFLSPDEDEPGATRRVVRRATFGSRILKAGILTTSVAAIVFAILSVESPITLFANATASLIGISSSQSATAATAPAIQPPAVQLTAEDKVLAPAAVSTPTRDEIAAALKNAQQSLAEIYQPPATAATPRRINADELAALLKRAKDLIAIGDIAPARLLLERAADAQEASAALLLAQTWDPAVLGEQDMRSIAPDPAIARGWYQKAAQFGSPDARQRLAQMQN
jgi:hypothetical protein